MITANEASKIAEENRKGIQKTIEDVEYLIDIAVTNGKHSFTTEGFISNEITNILIENGYKVNESDTHFQVIW